MGLLSFFLSFFLFLTSLSVPLHVCCILFLGCSTRFSQRIDSGRPSGLTRTGIYRSVAHAWPAKHAGIAATTVLVLFQSCEPTVARGDFVRPPRQSQRYVPLSSGYIPRRDGLVVRPRNPMAPRHRWDSSGFPSPTRHRGIQSSGARAPPYPLRTRDRGGSRVSLSKTRKSPSRRKCVHA
jgi:hypothetical protein